jgi:toxin ParE1/3/4
MIPVFRSPAAERDLEDIWLTIAVDNPPAATRMVLAIGRRIDQLASSAWSAPPRHSAPRMLVEGPYLILFETHPDTDDGPVDQVEIVRIIDGRRDLTNLF